MDAIFAADDVSAHGAIRAVQAAGLACRTTSPSLIRRRLLLSQYINPPLTTVRAPLLKKQADGQRHSFAPDRG